MSPARTDRALVLGSAVPLRALVRDDLGIGKVELEIYDGITDDLTGTRALPLDRIDDPSVRGGSRDAALASLLVEVDNLAADGNLAEGAVVALRIAAEDLRCLLYTSPSPRDQRGSRMPSSA